jgi:HD-GYP domain-containing protein (c-di-GMP phosphodiesterase class II)
MIEELLKDLYSESIKIQKETPTEKHFIESILDNIYQFLYKKGQPIHTIGIGILRGNTFDMYYKGRLINKFKESFGAMSYDTTIAGLACEYFKKRGQKYLNLYSKKKIINEFNKGSEELKKLGLKEEGESLRKRGIVTIDQGIGSFLLMPLSYNNEIIGILTISSLKESTEKTFLGENIENKFIPIAQLLNLILYMEKISYEKAEEMGKLLISSIDAKDEYQATHSLNVRTIIDIFIDEISRDKELRERVESIGFNLTVDKIEKLRFAALLHDVGKIFIPNEILRKSNLTKEEHLIRKMHPYLSYTILSKSKTLKDIAETASMHHAKYHISTERIEKNIIGYPFDIVGQDKFIPETQIIALADTLNSIIRIRPDGKGLPLSEGLNIIEKIEDKYHEGIKDIFLKILRRVEKNLNTGKYPPIQTYKYRKCLWLDEKEEKKKYKDEKWNNLIEFLRDVKFNNLGIITLIKSDEIKKIIKNHSNIKIIDKKVNITKINEENTLLSIRNIPNEQGFIWIFNIYEYLKSKSFNGKVAFAFIGKSGCVQNINNIYNSLIKGLDYIQNEPVHYYLDPNMYNCCEIPEFKE